MNVVAAPTFSVPEGDYSVAQSVTLASTTADATIYYTLDGTAPTAASTPYSGEISVTSSTVIMAFAVLSGWTDSTISAAAYTINSSTQLPPSLSVPGLSGSANVIVKDSVSTGCTTSPNCLIVGGDFAAAGTLAANNIVKIKTDGSFAVMGTGMDGQVNALAIDSAGNVYAAGRFTTAGGVSAANIAKWNVASSTWSALGTGLTGDDAAARALALDSAGNLYAAAESWNQETEVSSFRIAKWNVTSSSWSDLVTEMDGYANSLAFDGSGNLYAGGAFTTIGGVTANYIANWNVASSTWSALGAGMGDHVIALAMDSAGNLFAGGDFLHRRWRSCKLHC